MTQPWHTLTPQQQQWAWQHHYAEQQLALQRQHMAASRARTSGLLWLFVWIPLILGGLIVLISALS